MTLKYAKNAFAAGALPRHLLRELMTLPRHPSRLGRGIPLPTPYAWTNRTESLCSDHTMSGGGIDITVSTFTGSTITIKLH